MNILSKIHYSDRQLTGITACISILAFIYFYTHGQENLAYYDALARLNTARKMIDSITPGIGQLGGIWLPFPQILFIPFIWNNYLWHSGLAGYFVTGTCFVLGAVALQKAVYTLTNSRKVAMLLWFLFVSNVNILLLQTMAMSEVFFLCFFILTVYYLILWIRDHKVFQLLQIAFCLMVLTLTRYEGDFVLAGVTIAVVIECFRFYTFRKWEQIEGLLLVYATVAGFGVILWCIYSALFYKDPLFWLHAYTPPPASVLQQFNTLKDQVYGIQNPNIFQSFMIYSTVMLWTNGVLIVLLGILGAILSFFRQNRTIFSLWIVSVVLFLFLIAGYYKGFIPHIEWPTVYLLGNHVRAWSVYADNNVRYGIVILPCILFFAALAAAKDRAFFIIAILVAVFQVYLSFTSPKLLQYPFDKSWRYPHLAGVSWFRTHYDGGLVLTAASLHEDFIFETGLPYRDFIYEGTRHYWYDSLNTPSLYAKWIIYDDTSPTDDVTTGLTQNGVNDLRKNFQLVYQYKGTHIYELKPNYPKS